MREAEEHLKGMEKCCGLCTLPCMRSGDFEVKKTIFLFISDFYIFLRIFF
jgi:hypothetical protein